MNETQTPTPQQPVHKVPQQPTPQQAVHKVSQQPTSRPPMPRPISQMHKPVAQKPQPPRPIVPSRPVVASKPIATSAPMQ